MKNNFKIQDGKVFIDIEVKGQTKQTVIDEADFEKVGSFQGTWYGKVDNKSGKVYVAMNRKRHGKFKTVLLHRVVLGLDKFKTFHVDHKDFNTLHNTRSNLKGTCSRRNMQRKNDNISKVKKVSEGYAVFVKGERVGTFNSKAEAQVEAVIQNRENFPELEEFHVWKDNKLIEQGTEGGQG